MLFDIFKTTLYTVSSFVSLVSLSCDVISGPYYRKFHLYTIILAIVDTLSFWIVISCPDSMNNAVIVPAFFSFYGHAVWDIFVRINIFVAFCDGEVVKNVCRRSEIRHDSLIAVFGGGY